MENIEVIFFDLFFSLVLPHYFKNNKDNEYYDLRLAERNGKQ